MRQDNDSFTSACQSLFDAHHVTSVRRLMEAAGCEDRTPKQEGPRTSAGAFRIRDWLLGQDSNLQHFG